MIVGVEIASDALVAVCFERFDSAKAPDKLLEVALPLPSGQEHASSDGLSDAIADLVRKTEASGARIAVAVPSATCLFRVASFPYRSGSRIMKTLRYAMEDRVPGPVEEYIVEPVSDAMAAGDRGARLTVAACHAQHVERILAAFRDAGVDPCIVQPAVVSLARYVALSEASTGDSKLLIVRVGAKECELAWVDRGELRACETIRMPQGDGGESQGAETVADKIVFAVRAYQVSDGSADFDRVLLVESGNAGESLAEALQSRLDVAVSESSSPPVQGQFAAAWAVAAEAATRKHRAPTLRRDQWAYRPFARRCERRIAAALVLGVAILCMLGIRTLRETSAAERDLVLVMDRQSAAFSTIGAASHTLYEVDAVLGSARDAAHAADRNRVVSCIERWRALKELAPAMALMTFEEIDINKTRTKVSVMARDSNVAGRFRKRITMSETFVPDPYFKQETVPGKGVSLIMELRYR